MLCKTHASKTKLLTQGKPLTGGVAYGGQGKSLKPHHIYPALV